MKKQCDNPIKPSHCFVLTIALFRLNHRNGWFESSQWFFNDYSGGHFKMGNFF